MIHIEKEDLSDIRQQWISTLGALRCSTTKNGKDELVGLRSLGCESLWNQAKLVYGFIYAFQGGVDIQYLHVVPTTKLAAKAANARRMLLDFSNCTASDTATTPCTAGLFRDLSRFRMRLSMEPLV